MKNRPCRSMVTLMSALALLAVSCKGGAQAIVFGSDFCHHCKMTLLDRRFGGEIVNENGKVFKFDSLDCLRAFQKSHPRETGGDKAQVFVLDGSGSGELLGAADAQFTEHPEMHAPMGKPWIAEKRSSAGLTWAAVEKKMDE